MQKQIIAGIFCIIFFLSIYTNAQVYNHNLNTTYDYELNRSLYSSHKFHTSVRPYIKQQIKSVFNQDSLLKEKEIRFRQSKSHKFKNIIFNKPFIDVQEGEFNLIINPSFNLSLGKDFSNSINTYINSRGIEIKGSLGKKFSFYATIYENQARFPLYINNYINKNGAVLGQGLKRDFGDGGFDYAQSSGYISYSPNLYLNIQFGTDKNFIGDGYRSLFLSDNAFNYPFLKLTATVWRLKYICLFTEFMDFEMPYPQNERFDKKYAAIHYLSWNVNRRFTFGFFEGIIFPAKYKNGTSRGFEFNYLNPIIFYRNVQLNSGSPDNAVLGANMSYQIQKNSYLYGQFLFDEFRIKDLTSGNGHWANKFGYQLGIKCFEFLKVKNLYIQFEYNRVRPYTYSHRERIQAYGHYNQPLAHPFGANFWEIVTIANYHRKRLYFNYQFIVAKYGDDINGQNYGKNIFLSNLTRVQETGNYIGQGLKTTLLYNNLECSYLINPSYNLNFVVGFTNRITKSDAGKNTTNYIYIGLRTSINNFYSDF